MTFNRPLKRGLPLILFEDVSMIQRSKEDGIITPGGLILVQKSSVRDSIIDSITSLESFSLVHSICSMNYEDGMYDVRSVNSILLPNNYALERKRNLHSIHLDSDGCDLTILNGAEFSLDGENTLHTSLQPFSRIVNDIQEHSRLYHGKCLRLCFIQPNQEIIEYIGFKPNADISSEEKSRHVKFNSILIGERNENQRSFVCRRTPKKSNPNISLRKKLSKNAYQKLLQYSIQRMQNKMHISFDLSELKKDFDLGNLFEGKFGLSAYYCKDNSSRPDNVKLLHDSESKICKAKSNWWVKQNQAMSKLLNKRDRGEIKDLFSNSELYLPLEISINEASIKSSIIRLKPIKFEKLNTALERIFSK